MIIRVLQTDDFAVDYKALQLLDYPKVIKKPMDLGTIQEKLLKGSYSTLREVCFVCYLSHCFRTCTPLHPCNCQPNSLSWMWNLCGPMRFCTTKTPRIWCMLPTALIPGRIAIVCFISLSPGIKLLCAVGMSSGEATSILLFSTHCKNWYCFTWFRFK